MDEKLKQLEAENRLLLTQKSQEELDRLQMKKQSMKLSLTNTTSTSDVQTDTMADVKTTGTETCDTFHTANSDCSFASALPSPFPPRAESHHTPVSDVSELPEDRKALMSDSGVCLDAKTHEPPTTSSTTADVHPIVRHCFDGDNMSTNSSQNFYEHLLQSQMAKLREEIAGKKAQIMKILETGGKKSTLDEMINDLEELQKEYVKLEMRLETSRGKNSPTFFIILCFHLPPLPFQQMVAFRTAKHQRNYEAKLTAATAMNHVIIIRWRCRLCQRETIASRRVCLLNIS